MSILKLQCKPERQTHPEGIFAAVCVDVLDLGRVDSEFQGRIRSVPKIRIMFETEHRDPKGQPGLISKTCTASLHTKARLAEFLGKWRGRPVAEGECIDLEKLIGSSCTLVISHQQNLQGRTYSCIDAISKPNRKLAPSGTYDPAEARRRIQEWKSGATNTAPSHSPTPALAASPVGAAVAAAPADTLSDIGF